MIDSLCFVIIGQKHTSEKSQMNLSKKKIIKFVVEVTFTIFMFFFNNGSVNLEI
jgi:hypothetical protein